jgi:hypothetical protein
MKLKKLAATLINFAFVITGLIGCVDKPHQHVTEIVNSNQRIYMGNPESLIANTKTNNTINNDVFNKNQTYYLKAFVTVTDTIETDLNKKINIEQDDIDSPLRAMSFSHEQKSKEHLALRFSADSNNELAVLENYNKLMRIHFVNSKGDWKLKAYEMNPITVSAELIHFSMTPDKKYFSILSREQNPESKIKSLTSFIFTTGETYTEQNLKQIPYAFLRKNKLYRWQKETPIKLSICGSMSDKVKNEVRMAAERWQNAGKDLIQIEIDEPKIYPPFSDLNTHCILEVVGLPASPHKDILNYGATISLANEDTDMMIDSDILIFKDEFEKTPNSTINYRYEDLGQQNNRLRTYLHEMGHFFGLGHQFDKRYPSIMSYDDKKEPKLELYDVEALRFLYEQ